MIFYTTDLDTHGLKLSDLPILYSFAYMTEGIKNQLKKTKKEKKKNFNKVFLDSGAFSIFTRGISIGIDNYIEFCKENAALFEVMASFDVIPSAKYNVIDAGQKSWENYLYMLEKGVDKNKLIPIFHYGEPYSFFQRMIDHGCDYIGIAPSQAKSSKRKYHFISACFDLVKKSKRDIKIHGFGVSAEKMMVRYPFYSADSAKPVRLSSNGYALVRLPNGKSLERLKSSERSQVSNHLSQLLQSSCERYGMALGTSKVENNKIVMVEKGVTSCYVTRFLHNVYAMHDFIKNRDKNIKYVVKSTFDLI